MNNNQELIEIAQQISQGLQEYGINLVPHESNEETCYYNIEGERIIIYLSNHTKILSIQKKEESSLKARKHNFYPIEQEDIYVTPRIDNLIQYVKKAIELVNKK